MLMLMILMNCSLTVLFYYKICSYTTRTINHMHACHSRDELAFVESVVAQSHPNLVLAADIGLLWLNGNPEL